MELNLHQLEIFLCIARERSFSKAAERLRISQPSVSIQIRNLEASLEVKLFERLGRRVYLTREGKVVLEHAKKISAIVSGLQNDIKGLKGIRRGQLSAGCSRVPSATLLCPSQWPNSKRNTPRLKFPSRQDAATRLNDGLSKTKWTWASIEGDPAAALLTKEPWGTRMSWFWLSRRGLIC